MRDYGVETWVEAMEAIAAKMGVVLLVLGGMHFFNLLLLSKFRRRAMTEPPPRIAPVAQPVTSGYTEQTSYAR